MMGASNLAFFCTCPGVQVLTETFNWIRSAVQDFLLPAFNVKALLDWAKEGLGSANSATRTAAVQLLGILHAFLGPALADMVCLGSRLHIPVGRVCGIGVQLH